MNTDRQVFNCLVIDGWRKISNHEINLKKAIKNQDFDAYLEYLRERAEIVAHNLENPIQIKLD